MPCGGGDIGLNVWVEKGDLLFYVSRSGTFDENNQMLKLGRVRLHLSPNPFEEQEFSQELQLEKGSILLNAGNANLQTQVRVWVDVFRPVIHVEVNSNRPVDAEAGYESWRTADRVARGKANNANSYKWAARDVVTYKDQVAFEESGVLFYHHNRPETVFDVTVQQQGLESVKPQLFDPLKNLLFGGYMTGANMKAAGTYTGRYQDTDFEGWRLKSSAPARSHQLLLFLNTAQTGEAASWKKALRNQSKDPAAVSASARQKTAQWWQDFWQRSFVFIHPPNGTPQSPGWQAGRNYQVFRYMLGCNAYGAWPTKFNGGLFTYDPFYIDTSQRFTPDFRNWGGGTMTAQNQRLVYFPMLKSGDFDMMKPQFDFYLHSQRNAELRSEVYWKHGGACFTEQIENFGLPNCSEYGWNHPADFDKGMEYNAWLEYLWDTVLEFCNMMLETEKYTGGDITRYVAFVESCLRFFNEHYQYLAKQRGNKAFDQSGHLILFPGSGAETYKMAYNSTSTIAGLQTVLTRLLELPGKYLSADQRAQWSAMLKSIPAISFQEFDGHKTLAPARLWERINNVESPQLYPVFPWGIYGLGKPDLETALNTWKYDTNAIRFRSHIGWKQDNIFAARLGLTEEAARLTFLKLKDSDRRFPAFWGPGFDWTPDHNWGGSGMIGLQEMLMQTDDRKIILFPAWPAQLDVHFKLHAPYSTTVEATLKNGQLTQLKVLPESRRKDVINWLKP